MVPLFAVLEGTHLSYKICADMKPVTHCPLASFSRIVTFAHFWNWMLDCNSDIVIGIKWYSTLFHNALVVSIHWIMWEFAVTVNTRGFDVMSAEMQERTIGCLASFAGTIVETQLEFSNKQHHCRFMWGYGILNHADFLSNWASQPCQEFSACWELIL